MASMNQLIVSVTCTWVILFALSKKEIWTLTSASRTDLNHESTIIPVINGTNSEKVDPQKSSKSNTRTIELSFYHRYSPKLAKIAQEHGIPWKLPSTPLNTPEFHQSVAQHDLARHVLRRKFLSRSNSSSGRNRAHFTTEQTLIPYSGDSTSMYGDGFQYTVIDIGTPSVAHFVKLDIVNWHCWLPCDCRDCSSSQVRGFDPHGISTIPLSTYMPMASTTASEMLCADVTVPRVTCPGASYCSYSDLTCRYEIDAPIGPYRNSSSTGKLFEDQIHFRPKDSNSGILSSKVIVGCGSQQTFGYYDGSTSPDGALGLGPGDSGTLFDHATDEYTLPTLMASAGLAGDSFSLCFAGDNTGRLIFGDFGSNHAKFTAFLPDYPAYAVQLNKIVVGAVGVEVRLAANLDTEIGPAYLPTEAYDGVIAAIDDQMRVRTYRRVRFDALYDRCYRASSTSTLDLPKVSFQFEGDVHMRIMIPIVEYVYVRSRKTAGFCFGFRSLGSDDSTDYGYEDFMTLGVNFMIGYNLIFDREQQALGLEQTDCAVAKSSSVYNGPKDLPLPSPFHYVPSPPAFDTTPDSTVENETEATVQIARGLSSSTALSSASPPSPFLISPSSPSWLAPAPSKAGVLPGGDIPSSRFLLATSVSVLTWWTSAYVVCN